MRCAHSNFMLAAPVLLAFLSLASCGSGIDAAQDHDQTERAELIAELQSEYPDVPTLDSLSIIFWSKHTFQIQRDLPTRIRFETPSIYDVVEVDSMLWLRFDWIGNLFFLRADVIDTSELESSRLLRRDLVIIADLERVEPVSLSLSSEIIGLEDRRDGFPPAHMVDINGASARLFVGHILAYRALP